MARFAGPPPEVPDTFGAVTLGVVAERAAALVPGFRAFLAACSLPGDPVGAPPHRHPDASCRRPRRHRGGGRLLASDAARHVTMQELSVDGGASLQT